MRRTALLLLLGLACLGAGPARCGDDPTPALEKERAGLLERTVPKSGFWEAVGRKGELLKEEKALEEAGARLVAEVAAAGEARASAEAGLAAAREERRRAEEALEAAREERARALAERERREALLAAFASRHGEGGVE